MSGIFNLSHYYILSCKKSQTMIFSKTEVLSINNVKGDKMKITRMFLLGISMFLLDIGCLVLDIIGLFFACLPYLACGTIIWFTYSKACLSHHLWLQIPGYLVIIGLILLIAPPIIREVNRQLYLRKIKKMRWYDEMIRANKARLIDQDEW